ncbi:MAG: SIS domain-containing protein [Candidatus Brockarchaeota archaeon]|nr:SIS domain-containing protein [Candidatus Brockarchaeota archaeon]
MKVEFGRRMLEEIYAEPEAVRLTAKAGEKGLRKAVRALGGGRFQKVFLVGCGSSHYTGIAGKYAIEEFAKVPSSAVPALEFVHYASSIVDDECLVVCISQSGETFETLKALKKAKERGARVLGFTNDGESTLAKEADLAILTFAGEEKGPGTKTVVTQMMHVYNFALVMAGEAGLLAKEKVERAVSSLKARAPKTLSRILRSSDGRMRFLASKYGGARDVYIVGSGPCFPCALQASNLIKEAAKIHAEAFSVEEFRHGPMEALDFRSVFVAVNPPGRGRTSLLKLAGRVKKTGARIISLAGEDDSDAEESSDDFVPMPKKLDEWQASFMYLPALQLLAYYLAAERKVDPDRFRNIMKTWTTE